MNEAQSRELYAFIRAQLAESDLSDFDQMASEFALSAAHRTFPRYVLEYIERLIEIFERHDSRIVDTILDTLNENVAIHKGEMFTRVEVAIHTTSVIETRISLRSITRFREITEELSVVAEAIRNELGLNNGNKLKP